MQNPLTLKDHQFDIGQFVVLCSWVFTAPANIVMRWRKEGREVTASNLIDTKLERPGYRGKKSNNIPVCIALYQYPALAFSFLCSLCLCQGTYYSSQWHVSMLHYVPVRNCVQLPLIVPWREAGDFWCLRPVWNLRAFSLIPLFYIYSSFVLLPSPVALSVLFFSALGPFSWLLFP